MLPAKINRLANPYAQPVPIPGLSVVNLTMPSGNKLSSPQHVICQSIFTLNSIIHEKLDSKPGCPGSLAYH